MRKSRFLLAPLTAAVLAACAVGPDYQAPEQKVPDRFEHAGAASFAVQPDAAETSLAQFWRTFQDPTLDGLVSEAVAANHDLRIALTRVREARALRRDAAFDLAPSINTGAGYTRQRTARVTTQPGAPRET